MDNSEKLIQILKDITITLAYWSRDIPRNHIDRLLKQIAELETKEENE